LQTCNAYKRRWIAFLEIVLLCMPTLQDHKTCSCYLYPIPNSWTDLENHRFHLGFCHQSKCLLKCTSIVLAFLKDSGEKTLLKVSFEMHINHI
jgi:hypothetical protein